ncbi:MAG: hypothetical protein HYX87_01220 [Chloroflexi bacterium]|nr:hypothetical protein [Chloroflexota bacterium]
MRNLVENIKASYEVRTSGIANLRGQVATDMGAARAHISELNRSRQDMSRQLRDDLGTRHAARAKAEAQRKSSADSWLKDTAKARQSLAKGIRENLAREHYSRVDAEAQRSSRAQDFLKGIAAGRNEMAASLKASLNKSHSDREQVEAQRKSRTETELKGIAASRKKNAEKLRSSLGKGRSDLAKAAKQKRSQTLSWLKSVADKQAEDHAAWQNMSASLKSKRSNGGTPTQEPEEGGSHAQVDLPALSDRVFERVAGQPGGTRLAEMEQEFGVSRFQIDKALKTLIERGKVEKRDRLYFAI